MSVLDLCTGSGVLAVTAARAGAASVTAVDVSRRALLTTRVNARRNGVRVRTVRGSLLDAVSGESFDLIVSNPPYVPAVEDEIPRRGPARAWDAGLDGRALLDEICVRAPEHLRPGGRLLVVHSSVIGTSETVQALAEQGLEAEVIERRRGGLGPLIRGRAALLRERGMLRPGQDDEELVVIRAKIGNP